jgi:ATPase family associated with various cellular activities (AAA)
MTTYSVNKDVNIFQYDDPIAPPKDSNALSRDSKDILQRMKKINESYFFWNDKVLVNKLRAIQPLELTKVLRSFFIGMIEEGPTKDSIKALDRLARVIPFEKMQKSVSSMDNPLEEAKSMFAEAKFYLDAIQEKASSTFFTGLTVVMDGMFSLIESIISVFGIEILFKPSDKDFDGSLKYQKIMMLMSLSTLISNIILPAFGFASASLFIGEVLLCIAAVSVIWPWVKPMPVHLPSQAQNWTKQIQGGSFVAQGRKESLDEIANILKMNRHALLVGPSRVGKSLTAKAFAEAIEKGDYPELKGKVVFYINTKKLVDQKVSYLGGGNDILSQISNAIGRHRDDIILVLDEVHMACKNNEKMADELKTFLDEGGAFPHVIAITTEEEYERYVKDNHAFALRFDRVDIQNTSRRETIKILSDALLKRRSNVLMEEGALDYIYDKSKEVAGSPQPATSLKILKQCINRTEKTQKSPIEKKIIEVSNEILSLRAQAAAYRGRKKTSKTEIADLEKQLVELKKALCKEQKELKSLFQAKDLLDQVTQETYKTALKISNIAQKALSPNEENQIKTFVLLREFLGSLEDYIKKKAGELGVKAVIDNALVDEVLEFDTKKRPLEKCRE